MQNNAVQRIYKNRKKEFASAMFLLFCIFLMAVAISSIFWGEETLLFFGFPSSFVFFFALQIILSVGMAWFAKYHWKEEE
jgi:fatty acid desaturase